MEYSHDGKKLPSLLNNDNSQSMSLHRQSAPKNNKQSDEKHHQFSTFTISSEEGERQLEQQPKQYPHPIRHERSHIPSLQNHQGHAHQIPSTMVGHLHHDVHGTTSRFHHHVATGSHYGRDTCHSYEAHQQQQLLPTSMPLHQQDYTMQQHQQLPTPPITSICTSLQRSSHTNSQKRKISPSLTLACSEESMNAYCSFDENAEHAQQYHYQPQIVMEPSIELGPLSDVSKLFSNASMHSVGRNNAACSRLVSSSSISRPNAFSQHELLHSFNNNNISNSFSSSLRNNYDDHAHVASNLGTYNRNNYNEPPNASEELLTSLTRATTNSSLTSFKPRGKLEISSMHDHPPDGIHSTFLQKPQLISNDNNNDLIAHSGLAPKIPSREDSSNNTHHPIHSFSSSSSVLLVDPTITSPQTIITSNSSFFPSDCSLQLRSRGPTEILRNSQYNIIPTIPNERSQQQPTPHTFACTQTGSVRSASLMLQREDLLRDEPLGGEEEINTIIQSCQEGSNFQVDSLPSVMFNKNSSSCSSSCSSSTSSSHERKPQSTSITTCSRSASNSTTSSTIMMTNFSTPTNQEVPFSQNKEQQFQPPHSFSEWTTSCHKLRSKRAKRKDSQNIFHVTYHEGRDPPQLRFQDMNQSSLPPTHSTRNSRKRTSFRHDKMTLNQARDLPPSISNRHFSPPGLSLATPSSSNATAVTSKSSNSTPSTSTPENITSTTVGTASDSAIAPTDLGSPIVLDLSNVPKLSTGGSFYQQAPPPRKKIKNFVNDGPWSSEEHERFMEGYRVCGQNWRAISEKYVKSRTRVQVHAHAMKVLKNIKPSQEGSSSSSHTVK